VTRSFVGFTHATQTLWTVEDSGWQGHRQCCHDKCLKGFSGLIEFLSFMDS
jgi:hypothetical protein